MRKILLLIVLLLSLGTIARGQNTTVTGKIVDPNGNPWSNCSISANYADPPPNPSITRAANINGSPLQFTTSSTSCDGQGNFSIFLYDTAVIGYGGQTGGGTYSFVVSMTSQSNAVEPLGQPVNPRFTYVAPVCPTAGCVTGSTINIGAALSAVAPSLIPPVATLNPSVKVTTANPITLTFSNPAASRTYTVPDFGSNDSFAGVAATQSLSNKTLVSPTSTGTDNATFFDSGVISVAYTGGHKLDLKTTTAGSGCGTNAALEQAVMVYQ